MKRLIKSLVGLLFAFSLTGCFGEDYDVGVPTAHLHIDNANVQLTEANIDWDTGSEKVLKTVDNIEKFASKLNDINVFSGEKAFLDFKENEENGGDIRTDPKITVFLSIENDWIELELDESREFQLPENKGKYILVVEFDNSAGKAQYVGNIVVH